MSLKKFARVALAAALCVTSAMQIAHAQGSAEKPVMVIVPFSAGGSLDAVARALAQRLTEQSGRTFLVDNKPGASGNIGAQQVARSTPDGTTLLFTSVTTAAITGAMYTKGVGYSLNKDLVPLSMAVQLPVVLIASPASGIKTYADLVREAKTKKGGVTYGSAGPGSIEHVSGVLFNRDAKVDMLHVPYKGGADALRDLMGNQIDVVFGTGGGMFSAMDSGRAVGVAVAAANRAPIVPNLPTLQEAGLKGFDASVVYGFLAPAGVPAAFTAKLEKDLQAVLKNQETVRKIGEQSGEVFYAGAEQSKVIVQQQMEKWGKVVREANIKAD